MDPTRFDRLTRLISASASRRGALAALLAALAAPRGAMPDAAARRRKARGHQRDNDSGRGKDKDKHRKRKQKRKKRRTGAGAPPGQCCSRTACSPGPGKNLDQCCFQDRDLTARNFEGANLGQASFARANLTAATFSGANLDRTCFVDANTTGTRFGNANRGTAIFCRTETSSGIDNSGCGRGTPCCPTCDAAHPCGQDEVCCDGRCIPGNCCGNGEQSTCGAGQICCERTCVAGECCEVAGCAHVVCHRRACEDHQCVYTQITGEPGPGCDTTCCQDARGGSVCCDSGVTTCQESGGCGCTGDADCGLGQFCCAGVCEDGFWANQTTFGTGGSGPSQFSAPQGVAVSTDERTVWVADLFNRRISVWIRPSATSTAWTNQAAFGSDGPGRDQFGLPGSVAVAADGLAVWVADAFINRVSVWGLGCQPPESRRRDRKRATKREGE